MQQLMAVKQTKSFRHNTHCKNFVCAWIFEELRNESTVRETYNEEASLDEPPRHDWISLPMAKEGCRNFSIFNETILIRSEVKYSKTGPRESNWFKMDWNTGCDERS